MVAVLSLGDQIPESLFQSQKYPYLKENKPSKCCQYVKNGNKNLDLIKFLLKLGMVAQDYNPDLGGEGQGIKS